MIYEIGAKTGVYCIENAGDTRVFFVAAERTLIDAGTPGNADRILSALAQIGVQPLHVKRIVITHHHWDHVGSLWELKKRTGAEVIAHARDADYITGKRQRRPPRGALGRMVYTVFGAISARNVQGVDVDHRVNDGDRIGGFAVVHTPGHTPGHICLLREGYLFCGDLLQPTAGEFRETPHMFTADVPTSRASIRRVAELDFQFILASHSPPHVFGSAEKMREFVNRLGQLA
ncbi:MAG: MBL fold metallo-hydrolase [Chloroflexi bacterium]|nr:MBL fold metallo-hydrolase [Chloroflexota bacterium]